MPRIRTLKPEHRQHRKVGPLDHLTYRLWVGMILEADDDGRLAYDPAQLRAAILPFHQNVRVATVEASVARLEAVGLVRRYQVDDRCYLDFPSWRDHQRIDRKTESKLPSFNDSTRARRGLDEGSTRIEGSEGSKGSEGKDRYGALDEGSTSRTGLASAVARELMSTNAMSTALAPPPSAGSGHLSTGPRGAKSLDTVQTPGPAVLSNAAREVLAFLNRKAGKHFQASRTNVELIVARLREGATVDQCRAIIGLKCAKWKGDPKMHEYLRPETLFGRSKFAQYQGELPASAFEE